MEEYSKYIYIILGVIYLVYSFFKGGKENKKPSKPFSPSDAEEAKRKLEELLGRRKAEQVTRTDVRPQPVVASAGRGSNEMPVDEASFDKEQLISEIDEFKLIKSKRTLKKKHPLNKPEYETSEEFSISGNEENETEGILKGLYNDGFDMKKAVIYDAILNRPYA